jgi:hypothetical protein
LTIADSADSATTTITVVGNAKRWFPRLRY